MKHHVLIFTISILSLIGCHREIESQAIAGYISEGSDLNTIMITHPDSITPLKIAIQEETQFNGGAPIVGNIAEVVYLPAEEDGSLPTAVSVTADKTFPQALGKWESRNERNLDIEIELLPYGKIIQTAPSDILTYTSWHLTNDENIIELCGRLSLPAEKPKKDKKVKKSNDADTVTLPTRRIRSFRVAAKLGFENNNKVMTITTDNGRKSKLHFVEDITTSGEE